MANATRLPPDIGEFDVVTLNFCSSIAPDWRAVVDEAVRALAPGASPIRKTTAIHHPFQGEVNHFPFYPGCPIRSAPSAA